MNNARDSSGSLENSTNLVTNVKEILQNVKEEMDSVLSSMQEYISKLNQNKEKLQSVKYQISKINEFLNQYDNLSKKIIPVVVRNKPNEGSSQTSIKGLFNETPVHHRQDVRESGTSHSHLFPKFSNLQVLSQKSGSRTAQTQAGGGSPDVQLIDRSQGNNNEPTEHRQKKRKVECFSSGGDTSPGNLQMEVWYKSRNPETETSLKTPDSTSTQKSSEEKSSTNDEPEEIRTAIDKTMGVLKPEELRTFLFLIPQVDDPLQMTKVSFTKDIPLLYFQLLSLKYNLLKAYNEKESKGGKRCTEARKLYDELDNIINIYKTDLSIPDHR